MGASRRNGKYFVIHSCGCMAHYPHKAGAQSLLEFARMTADMARKPCPQCALTAPGDWALCFDCRGRGWVGTKYDGGPCPTCDGMGIVDGPGD